MKKLTFLHLSDLHFDESKWKDIRLVTEALLKDLMKMYAAEDLRPDFILFSGDVLNSGAPTAPFAALEEKVIVPLLNATSLTEDNLLLSPGNHDIDRQLVRDEHEIQAGLLGTLKDRASCNAFVNKHIHTDQAHHYFNRLKPFSKFSDRFGQRYRIRRTPFFDTFRVLLEDGFCLGVACLNTAWLASGEPNDVDRGKLIVPERAILDALEDLAGCQLKVAVLHHPLDYLAEHNRFDCRALLQKHFNLVCTGHLHQAMPQLVKSPIGEHVSSEASSLFADRSYYNGYAFITFDPAERRVEFIQRRWEDSPRSEFSEENKLGEHGRSSFQWGDAETVKRARTLLDVNRALKPILADQANEHILSAHTNTNAPKSFSAIYVDVPVAETSYYYGVDSPSEAPKFLSLDEIVQNPQPVVIFGSRESGKTALAYQLCLRICDGLAGLLRVPIFLDAAIIGGKNALAQETRKTLSYAQLQPSYEELSLCGSFVFILDNFRFSDSRQVNLVSQFMTQFPKNAYIFLCDERPGILVPSPQERPAFEHKALFIHPLKRPAVRELTRRWLSPSGLYSSDIFHTVMRKIDHSSLPATGYVVSLIAWTLEKHNPVAVINEASLLERFVDGILNKANLREVSRSSLDYTIKVAFLSELSHRLVEADCFVIEKNELVKFAIEFIEGRSWNHDAGAFVEQLIESGVLLCAGTLVAFRYRCFREYFLALYMIERDDYRQTVLSKDRYLSFTREIDIYTSLRRRDGDIVKRLRDYTEELVSQLDDVDLQVFDATKLKFVGLLKKPDSLADLGVTDEVIEKMLDEGEGRIVRRKKSTDLDGEKAQRAQAESRIEEFLRAYNSMLLLSKVIRNSELLRDSDLKRTATADALRYWASFICGVLDSFEQLEAATSTSSEARRRFEELPPASKAYLEYFIKVAVPALASRVIHESLGTDKLRTVFEGLLREGPPLVIRVLLAFLLLDMAANDRSGTSGAIKTVEEFIKGHGTRYLNELISGKLLTIYYTPNLGPGNRALIERIYSETQMKVHGLNSGKFNTSQARNKIVEQIRETREQIVAEKTDIGKGEDQ